MSDFDDLDADDLRALLVCARDDLLRLASLLVNGDLDGARADAAVLQADWGWPGGCNQYSDGTLICQFMSAHTFLPPTRRQKDT